MSPGLAQLPDLRGTPCRHRHAEGRRRPCGSKRPPTATAQSSFSDRLDLVTANVCEIAAIVDREILSGGGDQATWFMYYAGAGSGSTRDQGFENVILEVNSPTRFADRWLLPLFSRPGTRSSIEADPGGGRFDSPHRRSSDIGELERTVGDRVECFPEPAYTEATVNRYLRAGRTTVRRALAASGR